MAMSHGSDPASNHGTSLELSNERKSLMSGPGSNSSQSTALNGYKSTASDSSVEKSPGRGNGGKLWGRMQAQVETKELFIHHIPDEESGANDEDSGATWSDLIRNPVQDLTLRQCFLLFAVLLTTGTVLFSLIERWSILDSIYFTMVVLTTVGYGDICPVTLGGKLFAAAYGLWGVVVFGLILGVLGSQLVKAEMDYAEEMESSISSALETAFVGNPHPEAAKEREATQNVFDGKKNPPNKRFWCLKHFLGHLPRIASILGMLLAIAMSEKWAWYDAIYYFVVTATTIGFGDFAPASSIGRIIAILFVPILVGGTGYTLDNVASFIIEKQREEFTKKLWSKELKIEDLQALAKNNEEGVSEFEYIKFMLVAMNKVDGDLIDALHEKFQTIDVDGSGKIDSSDLKIMAAQKMSTVMGKMRLHEYKMEIMKGQSTSGSNLFAATLNKIHAFDKGED